MAKEFSYSFPNQMFTVGQQLAFQFKDKRMLILVVKDIDGEYWLKYKISSFYVLYVLKTNFFSHKHKCHAREW